MRNILALGLIPVMAAAAAAQDQQVGARTKAMGGSYTAFEDDPVSVWLNPGGIATQTDAMAVAYQTFTSWDVHIGSAILAGPDPRVDANHSWNEPAIIPSYLGFVTQLGDGETSHAIGFCFTSPFQLDFPVSTTFDTDVPGADFRQVYYRFRLAYARDFRFKEPGTPGFFTHLALGLAFDVGVSELEFKEIAPDALAAFGVALDVDDSDTGFGGGAGILLGVYDDTESFKMNVGAAYQSKINFSYSVTDTFITSFDWPNQLQVGATFYLLQGQPLRITVDGQFIDWEGATGESAIVGAPDYESAINYSIGLEYRLRIPSISEGMSFYPRVGFRQFDAPWDSDERQEQPAINDRRIVIDPDDDVYFIYSVGLGIGWASDDGKLRMVNLAFDTGGDINGFAFGFNLEM